MEKAVESRLMSRSPIGRLVATFGFLSAVQTSLWRVPWVSNTFTPHLAEIIVVQAGLSLAVALAAAYWAPLANLVESILSMMRSIFLLVFRQQDLRRQIAQIHEATHAIARIELFGEIFRLGRGEFKILHSCSGEHVSKKAPFESVPYDEVECVSRLWSLVEEWRHASVSGPCCCCLHRNGSEFDPYQLKGDYAIVGSIKHNAACEWTMQKLKALQKSGLVHLEHPYFFDVEVESAAGEKRCFLKIAYENRNDLKSLVPDLLSNAEQTQGQENRWYSDYAMIMRLPRLDDSERPSRNAAILLAGCKMAGQRAATRWLAQTDNLLWLARQDFVKNNEYFYVILKVFWRYGPGVPIIKEDGVTCLHCGKIEFSDGVAHANTQR